jgi:hypothetical protein
MVAIDERCPASDTVAKPRDCCRHTTAYRSINPGPHLDRIAIKNHRSRLF